ncbi:hypothetical protein BZG36_00140 [Bifiguratus adelaidae]|uniref:SAP domain-containing protein n=1 Tax=Bifiguratus adelaidae TaxID=1938954 RepID=A0A261Y887_9FUNG|nr:hypothetical protein BZG36_00140 [Bifiguratus adelaidae]
MEPIDKLKVPELQALCKTYSLPTKGKKADLIVRIKEYLQKQPPESSEAKAAEVIAQGELAEALFGAAWVICHGFKHTLSDVDTDDAPTSQEKEATTPQPSVSATNATGAGPRVQAPKSEKDASTSIHKGRKRQKLAETSKDKEDTAPDEILGPKSKRNRLMLPVSDAVKPSAPPSSPQPRATATLTAKPRPKSTIVATSNGSISATGRKMRARLSMTPRSTPITPSPSPSPSVFFSSSVKSSPPTPHIHCEQVSPTNMKGFLQDHFVGILFTSLHACYPDASPVPHDTTRNIICTIDQGLFANEEKLQVAMTFLVSNIWYAVNEYLDMLLEGRCPNILQCLEAITSIEELSKDFVRIIVRKEMDNAVSERGLIVLGCTGDIVDVVSSPTTQHARSSFHIASSYDTHHPCQDPFSANSLAESQDKESLAKASNMALGKAQLPPIRGPPSHLFSFSHPNCIHYSITEQQDPVRFHIAMRFLLKNAVSMDALKAAFHGKYTPITIGAQDCFYIDNVVLPRTIVGSGILCQYVAFVQTHRGGFFILARTGQIIGNEHEGISSVWQNLLGCSWTGLELDPHEIATRRDVFFGTAS